MTQEDKEYLDHARLWFDSTKNIDAELDLEIEFSNNDIDIRLEAIMIAKKRKEINKRQMDLFKESLRSYCTTNDIEIPSWI